MNAVLHTTTRYLALTLITTAGTFFAALTLVRHRFKFDPDACDRLVAYIAEQLG